MAPVAKKYKKKTRAQRLSERPFFVRLFNKRRISGLYVNGTPMCLLIFILKNKIYFIYIFNLFFPI